MRICTASGPCLSAAPAQVAGVEPALQVVGVEFALQVVGVEEVGQAHLVVRDELSETVGLGTPGSQATVIHW